MKSRAEFTQYIEEKDIEMRKVSNVFGCLDCVNIFDRSDLGIVKNMIVKICPECSSQEIVGDASGYVINEQFINAVLAAQEFED